MKEAQLGPGVRPARRRGGGERWGKMWTGKVDQDLGGVHFESGGSSHGCEAYLVVIYLSSFCCIDVFTENWDSTRNPTAYIPLGAT